MDTSRRHHMSYQRVANYQIASVFYDFINHEVLANTGLIEDEFWQKLCALLDEFSDENAALLAERERLQQQIDAWHQGNDVKQNAAAYQNFLYEIGYLRKLDAPVSITTNNVDDDIAHIAGPQLVVPLSNARYALNAANARWGSLYDALYASDIIADEGELAQGGVYNPRRGQAVIDYARTLLDQFLPLKKGSHAQAQRYFLQDQTLLVALDNGEISELKNPECAHGYVGEPSSPKVLLFQHNGLHIELHFDPYHPIGQQDLANLKDIVLESAITTIMDLEDSIAAVDAEDKVAVYRHWLGLMKGELSASFIKNAKVQTRHLNPDRHYQNLQGQAFSLRGRALMFIRNVGHLMRSDLLLDANDMPVFEGIVDALISALIAMHDLSGHSEFSNSSMRSIYIVKPKMHGPDEVDFTCRIFTRVEQYLGLPSFTLKLGIMDEERRTSLNLAACIAQAKERLVFINTGFLDRTGDEIHTSMEAGVMCQKHAMKHSEWLKAYELNNVAMGLSCGLMGRAQIGKGMWPMPALMREMLLTKQAHPQSGASTAWVPSPTAATLHALHYHQNHVQAIQAKLLAQLEIANMQPYLDDLLSLPLHDPKEYAEQVLIEELDNNIQGILGYVVRWVEQGIGCSTVPNIHGVGLMEDRATLRISSQHLANWLYHGVVTKEMVMGRFEHIAALVDAQNADDPNYRSMADKLSYSHAYLAALDLVFKGREQPSGYTEPLLHHWRQRYKADML